MKLISWCFFLPGCNDPSRLAGWVRPEGPAPEPSLEFLPPLARRRVSWVGKLALDLAHRLAPPTVMREALLLLASQHGEITTTALLLDQLTRGEVLSPAGFSHSVHNSPVGRVSLALDNRQPAGAVSAGVGSLGAGLVEALGLLCRYEGRKVALLFADEPVPAGLHPPLHCQDGPYGLGLLLGAGTGLEVKFLPGPPPPQVSEFGAAVLVPLLLWLQAPLGAFLLPGPGGPLELTWAGSAL
ncbi:MAG: hypothetical protein A2600_11520 [Candidatus Lambdaproteobacteria bacterium RIFOXYD1_FULL_56_27]|uniref:Beta-ketoacyl synthase-like N-terminal domain-containing protein n=1 Tax=Candidatus Lambdaproteobacteria bacterium RIFOXYD2_FULL_56_26 TaxID=1817773 RepID=A0A1F6H0X7_9PROT|nr:MAG: hypothetical protein A2426_01210 [Candidatus Lambdaproteobacteria bacterium RIFOXYC1_FULL_56_13]OGH03999.1 MAG: hypothetical protein A2557_11280 [Candidatus Lambdaproteobacteria bacterium RIFOXYD2_FULL_56_26]OGH08390.1 MAG: hypothetical protein A2600_11520 [Candidatus Lambdaproteobacteria bacterium RIFOXYD1_FULL_56_27]